MDSFCICKLFSLLGGMDSRLTSLAKNETAIVTGFDEADPDLTLRLREIGFAEGDRVTPLHFGLFGRNPISVRVNGALIALRKQDAKRIRVKRPEPSVSVET